MVIHQAAGASELILSTGVILRVLTPQVCLR